MSEITWFIGEDKSDTIPEWQRITGFQDDGRVFAPVILAGYDERLAAFSLLYDGAPFAFYEDHFYAPTYWIAKENPEAAELCEKIETRTRAWAADLSQE